MKTVWKYTLSTRESVRQIPIGAEFLSMGVQGDIICLWFLIPDTEAKKEQRVFEIFGTGQAIPSFGGLKFIGTMVSQNVEMVWHVFEVRA